MAIYTVSKLDHNTTGPGKAGKYPGSTIYWASDNGNKRIDFIFKSRKAGDQGSVIAELAVGDRCDVKIVKSGDFYNVDRADDAIKLLEKGDGKVSTIPSPASKSTGYSGGGYKEDPEKQAAIIRQNALTNATNLVVAMLNRDMFKKTASPDVLICEITRVATELVKYTSGATIAEISKDVKTADPVGEDDTDSEFGE